MTNEQIAQIKLDLLANKKSAGEIAKEYDLDFDDLKRLLLKNPPKNQKRAARRVYISPPKSNLSHVVVSPYVEGKYLPKQIDLTTSFSEWELKELEIRDRGVIIP